MDYSKTPLWMQDDLVKDIPREKLDFLSNRSFVRLKIFWRKADHKKITPGRLNVCQELFYSTFSQRHSQSRVITLSITT